MGAFDAGFIPPITSGAEEQLKPRRRKPKMWQRLREVGIRGVETSGDGNLTSTPVVATGVAAAKNAPVDDVEEKAHFGWTKKKPAVFKPDAIDGNGNGMVQDGTIQERPALPKKPKLPPLEKKKVDWKVPLLGQLLLGKPRPTDMKLKGEDGRYIKVRRQFHAKVVDYYMKKAGMSKPEGQRTVYFMGGGPASLKSTLLNSGKTNVPGDVLKIDTDEIKEFIPEYREWVENHVSSAANLTQEESKHISQLVTHSLLKGGHDFVLDTTGDGNYKGFKERVQGLREHGHRIVANYTTNDIQTALKLNEERFKQTGRKVPESNLRYIHEQVSRNIPQAIRDGLFDELNLYDTNNLEGGPKLILSYKDGKMKVHDPIAYKKFLDKGTPPMPAPKPPKPGEPGKPGKPDAVTHVWHPTLPIFAGHHASTGHGGGPFDQPPVNPNLPSPYGNPKKTQLPSPDLPKGTSGKPIPPPPPPKKG